MSLFCYANPRAGNSFARIHSCISHIVPSSILSLGPPYYPAPSPTLHKPVWLWVFLDLLSIPVVSSSQNLLCEELLSKSSRRKKHVLHSKPLIGFWIILILSDIPRTRCLFFQDSFLLNNRLRITAEQTFVVNWPCGLNIPSLFLSLLRVTFLRLPWKQEEHVRIETFLFF